MVALQANSARLSAAVWWPWKALLKRSRRAPSSESMTDSDQQPAETGIRSGGPWLHWPTRIFGPRPGLREVNLLCWGLLAGVLIARFAIPFLIQLRSGRGLDSLLPADFIYFYGIGHIAEHLPTRARLRLQPAAGNIQPDLRPARRRIRTEPLSAVRRAVLQLVCAHAIRGGVRALVLYIADAISGRHRRSVASGPAAANG